MSKEVILYSGGMDSFIMSHMYPNAFKLYVDVRSKYADKEIANLPKDVVVHRGLDLSMFERDDAIIPSRNLYMVLAAANYGDTIMLGATAGDQSHDKDETFAVQATRILNHMMSGSHFIPSRKLLVTLPIKNRTKDALIKWYLNSYKGDREALVNSVSCYSEEHLHCGVCKSCTRKWLALEANNLSFDKWHTHPSKADWTNVVTALQRGKWRNDSEDRVARMVLERWRVM